MGDAAPADHTIGDFLVEPLPSYRAGDQVRVVLVGGHPNNRLRRCGTYLTVERETGDGWTRVADDGDWSTKLHWARRKGNVSEITITWDIPEGQPGRYRIRYTGDARQGNGPARLSPIDSATPVFRVV